MYVKVGDYVLIKYKGKSYICPLDLGFEIIRGKWKAVILCHLSECPKRFMELQRITCGVSKKVLSETLKQHEANEIITKHVYVEVPPRVEYSLTQKGQGLVPALKIIEDWSKNHFLPISNKQNK